MGIGGSTPRDTSRSTAASRSARGPAAIRSICDSITRARRRSAGSTRASATGPGRGASLRQTSSIRSRTTRRFARPHDSPCSRPPGWDGPTATAVINNDGESLPRHRGPSPATFPGGSLTGTGESAAGSGHWLVQTSGVCMPIRFENHCSPVDSSESQTCPKLRTCLRHRYAGLSVPLPWFASRRSATGRAGQSSRDASFKLHLRAFQLQTTASSGAQPALGGPAAIPRALAASLAPSTLYVGDRSPIRHRSIFTR
jgi:hypothetical protein